MTAAILDHPCEVVRKQREESLAKAIHNVAMMVIGAVIGCLALTMTLVYTGMLELPIGQTTLERANVVEKAYSADGQWECYKPVQT
jgi:hypothetical protein